MGPIPEFQAVVLAGGSGSRFPELSSQKAKCLLPIGNLPMIWYPLQMLHKIGFQEVIVVAADNLKNEIASIPKKYGGLGNLSLDVVPLHSSSSSGASTVAAVMDSGTAEALRLIHDRLKSPHIMIVSSDLVTDLQIHNLTDLHRVHNASVTSLFFKNQLDFKAIPIPGPKSKPKKEKDVIGIDKSNGQICFLSSEADLGDVISLRQSMLAEHPTISMFTNLTDAHFYIMDKWVCDFLMQEKNIFSIRGELLPLLVKKQFGRAKVTEDRGKPEEDTPNAKEKLEEQDIYSFANSAVDDMDKTAQDLSCWNDHKGDMRSAYFDRLIRCYAYIMEGGFCCRVNNLYTYCDLNRQISKLAIALTREQPQIHPKSQVQAHAQIGQECFIGDSSHISPKTTVKNSMIGANCKVEEKTRTINSIIMDQVTIKEGCQINGSIICEGSTLPERCEIKDCIVGKGYSIAKGAKHSNELLVEAQNRMMEI